MLIYLHGWCGKIESVETWKLTAAAHGTLIAPSGDLKCPNGRTKWSKKTEQQHERIQRAIAAVQEARGGALDPDDILLIGYSQGAARAYRLARLQPNIYSRLVLGGPPEATFHRVPRPRASDRRCSAGELETTQYMRAGHRRLARSRQARPLLGMLPKSKHGEYGPEAERVATEGARLARTRRAQLAPTPRAFRFVARAFQRK